MALAGVLREEPTGHGSRLKLLLILLRVRLHQISRPLQDPLSGITDVDAKVSQTVGCGHGRGQAIRSPRTWFVLIRRGPCPASVCLLLVLSRITIRIMLGRKNEYRVKSTCHN